MTIGGIKLLGTPGSPYTNRVQFVLNLKSIGYEFIHENLACKSELLRKSNPIYKKVPVLFHANKPPMCESLIIIEYLDEIEPNVHPMLPSDPLARADNRFWAHYIDDKFLPIMRGLWLTQGKDEEEALKEKINETLRLLEQVFIKFSNGKTYFGGDEIGYLDVALGCFLGVANLTEKLLNFKVFDEAKIPGLARWAANMMSHEAITSVIPGEEPLMKFYAMVQTDKPST